MKTYNLTVTNLVAIILSILTSCETSQVDVQVQTADFAASINENPPAGQHLGTIEGSTNAGEVVFEVISQSPLGAVQINRSTGVLSVNDASLFDFEKNQIITGSIKVANGQTYKISSITITILDLIECDDAVHITKPLFQKLLETGDYEEKTSMDIEVHSYTFHTDIDGQICSIGYQGVMEAPYLIEILNKDGVVLYTGNHSFSTTEVQYFNIPAVIIKANESYTIKRTVENFDSLEDILGPLVMTKYNHSATLPVSEGHLTITDTPDFKGLPSGYVVLPVVHLGFVMASN